MQIDRSSTIQEVCRLLSLGEQAQAEAVIFRDYPFIPTAKSGRSYTPREMTRVFLRDGFIDRYKGTKLVYPPTLRVISKRLGKAFPYHKNGKMDSGHFAYWEVFPTIDHRKAVAHNGEDEEKNWVCCSMLTNSIKSHWTLEQLGWTLMPVGKLADWDGMIHWFVEQVENDKSLLDDAYIKSWFNAAKDVLRDMKLLTHEA